MSWQQYQNAKTVAAKYDQRLGVHPDFLQTVGDTTVYDETFYNQTFHVVWGNFGKSMFGPGDFVVFRFTPGALKCVSVHKPATTFSLGELTKVGDDVVFSGNVVWTFSKGSVKDGEPVYWITGTQDGRVVYNYSVVTIRF